MKAYGHFDKRAMQLTSLNFALILFHYVALSLVPCMCVVCVSAGVSESMVRHKQSFVDVMQFNVLCCAVLKLHNSFIIPFIEPRDPYLRHKPKHKHALVSREPA